MKWKPDTAYTDGSVCKGGDHKFYVCLDRHISSAATEPPNGPDCADKWSEMVFPAPYICKFRRAVSKYTAD